MNFQIYFNVYSNKIHTDSFYSVYLSNFWHLYLKLCHVQLSTQNSKTLSLPNRGLKKKGEIHVLLAGYFCPLTFIITVTAFLFSMKVFLVYRDQCTFYQKFCEFKIFYCAPQSWLYDTVMQ